MHAGLKAFFFVRLLQFAVLFCMSRYIDVDDISLKTQRTVLVHEHGQA